MQDICLASLIIDLLFGALLSEVVSCYLASWAFAFFGLLAFTLPGGKLLCLRFRALVNLKFCTFVFALQRLYFRAPCFSCSSVHTCACIPYVDMYTARRGQLRQESQNRIAEQESQNEKAERDRQNRTDRIVQIELDRQNRTGKRRQSEQDKQNWKSSQDITARKGLPGQRSQQD
jgi:hypothetical protein